MTPDARLEELTDRAQTPGIAPDRRHGLSPAAAWDDMVLVGVVARTHGLRGQVLLNAHTDFPEERFAPGAVVWTRRDGTLEALTVDALRFQSGRPVVSFEGVDSIETAGALVGCELRVPEHALMPLAANAYYEHQLVGCAVESIAGVPVGRVAAVSGGAGSSLLVIEGTQGEEVLVPLADDICVRIDVGGRRIVIAPPEGLLELNAPAGGRRRPRRGARRATSGPAASSRRPG